MNKRLTSLILCFAMLVCMALPASADEPETEEEIVTVRLTIASEEEFLQFAEDCRLDSYSRNLAVSLEADLDLTGLEFAGVPIFSGAFLGNGHTIAGLSLTADGSTQGLFRYLTDTAVVRDLNVSGEIHPGGSRSKVGAIAGRNEGSILTCSFTGSLSGGDYTGGLVGVNAVTGIIANCTAAGDVHGDHFVGGIAGENHGVIRGCSNSAQINTTPQQNSVEISDITMDTLTNTEAANTVTDIGGIAGSSSGVIRDCENHGDIGYPHMGYNIGGIAGTQSGYISGCTNYGAVQGRKEVGGIVGQMEPASLIEYSEDTLQILQQQLGTMSGLVNQASGNAQTNASQITGQIGALQDQAQTARDALDSMLPSEDNPVPDPDQILAAQNTLSSALNAMPGTLQNVASSVETTLNGLTRDLNAISAQISAMGETINGASENLGGSITDISDQDTPELLTGKVEGCVNYGSILADLNAGGIAGATAMENDLDILEDWEKSGEESLNFQSEVRAVVLNCENSGTVTGKKQNVGGIVGWQALGLVKNCINTGEIDAENADYAGGISGLSTGFIRSCYVKALIRGKAWVGGIAGSATILTDSLSQVKILGGKEKIGNLLGSAEESHSDEEAPVANNFYLRVDGDPGAIDGISYSCTAEPLALDAFLAIENLPELFRSVTIRFVFEDGSCKDFSITPGGTLDLSKIPAVPEKSGCTGTWEGLESAQLSNILFDMTFHAVYTPYSSTIESKLTRDNGLPLLLAVGSFTDSAAVTAEASDAAPDAQAVLESWSISLSEPCSELRLLMPDGADPERLSLFVRGADGAWKNTSFRADGSYLVFSSGEQQLDIALTATAQKLPAGYLIGIGAVLAAALAAALILGKKRRKVQPPHATADET